MGKALFLNGRWATLLASVRGKIQARGGPICHSVLGPLGLDLRQTPLADAGSEENPKFSFVAVGFYKAGLKSPQIDPHG